MAAKKAPAPKSATPTVADVMAVMDELAPFHLAESWDNVGLQLGSPSDPATRIMVALEVTREVLAEARKRDVQLLITHHPLVFRPVKGITTGTAGGDLLLAAARQGLALIAAHTNLDSVAWGTNGELADRLGLMAAGRRFLRPTPAPSQQVKYAVHVPESHAAAVIDALANVGAGVIGNYSHCTFRWQGLGTYRPLEGAHPTAGEIGRLEEAPEVRLEAVVPRSRLAAVLTAVRSVHPYEEIAYDVFPLENPAAPAYGLGLIGALARPITVAQLVARAKKELGTKSIGVVGELTRPVETVAICTGAAGEIVRTWRPGTADILVTGEMTHHDCLDAAHLGISCLLVGHWQSEVIVTGRVAGAVSAQLSERGLSAEWVDAAKSERPPLVRV